MEWLRGQWKVVLAVVAVSALGIVLFEPDYTKLQNAKDAAAFTAVLDSPARAIAAAVCDIVFAASYGLLGIVGMRVHGRGAKWATVGVVAVAVGALADEFENLFVIANSARHRTLTDGWITAMHVPGNIKWVATIAILGLLALLIVRAVRPSD